MSLMASAVPRSIFSHPCDEEDAEIEVVGIVTTSSTRSKSYFFGRAQISDLADSRVMTIISESESNFNSRVCPSYVTDTHS